jgi:hypothetical protein
MALDIKKPPVTDRVRGLNERQGREKQRGDAVIFATKVHINQDAVLVF